MSRRFYIITAFVLAVLATVIGWSHSLMYKEPPLVPLALWFPLIVIAGAREFAALTLSLIQFPLFASVFALGVRRWPIMRVLAVVVSVYGLLAGIAFAMVKTR
jgi:hypothetical protein